MASYKLMIQVLSPIHIGTEVELSPFDYVISDKKLHYFKLEKLLNNLKKEDVEQYYKFIDASNVLGLRSFILNNFNKEKDSIYSIPVTEKVESKYQNTINDLGNQLLVSPFVHHPLTFQRFLPGSSIKGALRTAVVDSFAHQKIKPIAPFKGDTKTFEPKSLSYGYFDEEKRRFKTDVRKDPFRCVKITDVNLPPDSTLVGEVLNARKLKNKERLDIISIQMIKEVVPGYLLNKDLVIETDLIIEDNKQIKSYFEKQSVYFDHQLIIKSCKSFYETELEREAKFYQDSDIEEFTNKLADINSKLKDEEFLLRLGRFSGVYAVTVNDFRNPRTRSGKFGTSRNLFEGKYPVGWLKCKLIPKN